MKKLSYLLFAASLWACQSKPATQTWLLTPVPATATKLPPAAVLPDIEMPVWHDYVVRDNLVSAPITKPAEIKHFFRQYKLTSILETATGSPHDYALNGFRGADKYRTEVVVQQARQDMHNPCVYYLTGLSRTRHRVTPFAGQVVLATLSREPLLTKADQENIQEASMSVSVGGRRSEPAARYAVSGKVMLWEKGNETTSAVFTGTLVMELALTESGKIELDNPFLHGPSQGGGLKYEGAWVPGRGGPAQPTVWVSSLIGYSLNIFGDLVIGERDVDINPKYAKLGWNEYWKNDEWWADSPKPSLNL